MPPFIKESKGVKMGGEKLLEGERDRDASLSWAEGSVLVNIDKLLSYANVLVDLPWGISVDPGQFESLVRSLAARGNVRSTPVVERELRSDVERVIEHAKRCAYFMNNECIDPISIDVGIPGVCNVSWIVEDGNHRFYGRALAGDEMIPAFISGSVIHAEEMFGVAL